MSDYVPKFLPGKATTATTSGDVIGGQLLAVSGDGTVDKTADATHTWLGVAAFDAVSGELVTVHHGGVQALIASGSIDAGDQVVSAADGKVSTVAAAALGNADDVNSARQLVGLARTSATDGNAVEIQMER